MTGGQLSDFPRVVQTCGVSAFLVNVTVPVAKAPSAGFRMFLNPHFFVADSVEILRVPDIVNGRRTFEKVYSSTCISGLALVSFRTPLQIMSTEHAQKPITCANLVAN